MPNYSFYNTETGEMETHSMKIAEKDAFSKNNPHLEQRITSPPGTVSQAKETLARTSEDWRQHLKNIKDNNGSGTNVKTY